MTDRAWMIMPGVPSAGHVTVGGWWHPGRAEGCGKCGDQPGRPGASSARKVGMEPTTTPAVLELRDAAAEYATLQAARNAALTRLQAAIRGADREGVMPRAQIVREAGVAKQTVYDALGEPDPGEPVTVNSAS